MSNENIIAGLLAERAGYAAKGLEDRVALVDEQLKHYGHTVEAQASPEGSAAKRAASQGAGEAPKRRGRPQQQTAEQQPTDET